MLRFQGPRFWLLSVFVLSLFIAVPNGQAQPAESSQRAGSQVTIPVTQLREFNSAKLMQYYPGQPYAKCLVPGQLFAPGGLLDLAPIEAGEKFTINFPNATINYESEGIRQEVSGYATIQISGLVSEGAELLAVCNISFRGAPTENNNYTISVNAQGAAPAPVLVNTFRAEANTIIEEPTAELVHTTVTYNPGTIITDSTTGESCPECDPPVGEGSTTGETPPVGEGSLGEPPRPIGEGEIGEGPLPRGHGDYEPLDPGEIDRGSGTPAEDTHPNDKVFVAQGTDAAAGTENQVTADPDFTAQNLVAMSGSGCTLATAPQSQAATWLAFFAAAGLLPLFNRFKKAAAPVK